MKIIWKAHMNLDVWVSLNKSTFNEKQNDNKNKTYIL